MEKTLLVVFARRHTAFSSSRGILQIGEGAAPEDRNALIDLAERHGPPFTIRHDARRARWGILYSQELLTPSRFKTDDLVRLIDALQTEWSAFLAHDFAAINQAICTENTFS